MSRRRKTIEIEAIRELTNQILQHSADDRKQAREGVRVMWERLSMDTGNYGGFGYLNSTDMKSSLQGSTVGINDDGSHDGADSSRLYFFKGRG